MVISHITTPLYASCSFILYNSHFTFLYSHNFLLKFKLFSLLLILNLKSGVLVLLLRMPIHLHLFLPLPSLLFPRVRAPSFWFFWALFSIIEPMFFASRSIVLPPLRFLSFRLCPLFYLFFSKLYSPTPSERTPSVILCSSNQTFSTSCLSPLRCQFLLQFYPPTPSTKETLFLLNQSLSHSSSTKAFFEMILSVSHFIF